MNQFLIGFAVMGIAAAALFAWQERQHRLASSAHDQVYAAALALVAEAQRRQEAHLLEVLNRFLSRSYQDKVMADMVGNEVRVDQDEEPDHEQKIIDDAVRAHVANLESEMRAAAGQAAAGRGT